MLRPSRSRRKTWRLFRIWCSATPVATCRRGEACLAPPSHAPLWLEGGACVAPTKILFRLILLRRRRCPRLLDLRLERVVQVLRSDRADQLIRYAAVAADNETLGDPVDAPFDRGAAIGIHTVRDERVAIPREKANRVIRVVLVIHAGYADAAVCGKHHQERRLIAAGYAP